MNASFEIGNTSMVQTLSKHDLDKKLKQHYAKYGQDAENLEIAQTLFDLGTIETDPDTAIYYLSHALFMYRTVYSEVGVETHAHIAQTLYRLGEAQLLKGDYDNARNSCEQAWEMYKALDEAAYFDIMSRVLEMLKEICKEQGDILSALGYASEATAALRKSIIHAPTLTQEEATVDEVSSDAVQVVAYSEPGSSSRSNQTTNSSRATPPKSNSCCFGLLDCFGLFAGNTQEPTRAADPVASPVHGGGIVR